MPVCYYVCMSTVFYGVYCYMKLQGYRRLVNCYRIYYTMNLLSLLTDALIQFYDYTIDGAIYSDKAVEENEQDGGSSSPYFTK